MKPIQDFGHHTFTLSLLPIIDLEAGDNASKSERKITRKCQMLVAIRTVKKSEILEGYAHIEI